jgi:hypothetical protein
MSRRVTLKDIVLVANKSLPRGIFLRSWKTVKFDRGSSELLPFYKIYIIKYIYYRICLSVALLCHFTLTTSKKVSMGREIGHSFLFHDQTRSHNIW